jgi:NAD(P)-dependent dehydrogenase (short-subunit alcohol dehydrogenase family)
MSQMHLATRGWRGTFTLLLTVTTLLLSGAVLAGGHRAPKPKPNVKLDATQRSDVTGTVLVTGANRGIGLALATNYAERGWTVYATARSPKKADELNALAAANPKVTVVKMDLLDHKSIDKLAKQLEGVPIDVLYNNAAILGDPGPQDFGNYDYDVLMNVMAVNVAGTLKMVEAFVDHVAASDQKKIVGMTSVQGSIGLLRDTSIPFYKMSKAALNMGLSSIALKLKGKKITVALVSPGAVDTQMMNSALSHAGMKKANFLITTEESAEACINVVDQFKLEYTGLFMSHEGDIIPW